MHRVKSAFFLAILLAVIFPAQTVLAQSAEELKETQKEIYAAWTAYLNSLKSFSGIWENHLTTPGDWKIDSVTEFVIAPPYLSSISSYTDTDLHSEQISLLNPKYYAVINYDDQSPVRFRGRGIRLGSAGKMEDSYRLREDWFDGDDFVQRVSKSKMNHRILHILGTPLRILPFWLPKMMKDDRFGIKSIEYQQKENEQTAEILLAETEPVEASSLYEILELRLTLMPDRYWLPVKAECLLMDRASGKEEKISLENEYDFAFSVPVLTRQVRNVDGEEPCSDITTITGIKENPPIQRKDFTLSHYGLAEPKFPRSSADFARPLLITLGGILIAFSLIQIYRKRRKGQA